MLKLVGCVCVMGSGTWLWWRLLCERRRRMTALEDLVSALELMINEIRMNRTPMPRLLLRAGAGRCDVVMGFFAAVRKACGDVGLAEAWKREAEGLLLAETERRAMCALGNALTGDEAQACRGMELVSKQLSEALGKQKEAAAETVRRQAALCFSGAALLTILLV